MKRTRYRFQKISNSHLFFWKEKLSFFAHQSLVASLSTLMEDWWISNFLKFNFTKRVYDSTKNTFEHVSNFRLKKLIINPLLAFFSHSCTKRQWFTGEYFFHKFDEKLIAFELPTFTKRVDDSTKKNLWKLWAFSVEKNLSHHQPCGSNNDVFHKTSILLKNLFSRP